MYFCTVKEDTDFFLRLNRHDVEAYRMLYQRFYKPLVLFALRFINEQMTAEDIVEDVIVGIWEKGISFENKTGFQSYLYNSVRNKCLNSIKRQNIEQRYAEAVGSENNKAQASYQGTEDDFVFEQMYAQMFEVLDSLPARCREVILLYVQGKKNAEIAAELQLSLETVKTHRKRALKAMREKLKMLIPFAFFLHLFDFS